MLKVEKKGDAYTVSELFKNPDFGAHTQPPVFHDGHPDGHSRAAELAGPF